MLPLRDHDHPQILFCPSILAADFMALGEAVAAVESQADMIHVDVMDGHFVPNLSMGPAVVRDLRRRTRLPIDVHLMTDRPMDWLKPFADSGADSLVVHVEACPHLLRALQAIREQGCTPGVAINPGTPLSLLEDALPHADLILLMTVNPGFGGQRFIPEMVGKIRRLRQMIDDSGRAVHLQIDGGIDHDNLAELVAAGADTIVAGSAVFGQPDPAKALAELRQCAAR